MSKKILLKDVRVNNLKEVDLELNHGEFIVFTGVSGSGKSSLAFDTIYTEGQRRYIESLSHYARRYLGDQKKPDAKKMEGIAPTIAIEQKTQGKSPRSTVGTMTGIYDFLRVLFAKISDAYCPVSGESLHPQSRGMILSQIKKMKEGSKLILLAPFEKQKKGEFKEEFKQLVSKGFSRVRVDGKLVDLSEEISLEKNKNHDVEIVIDRISLTEENYHRITESLSSALDVGKGICIVWNYSTDEEKLFSEYSFSPKSNLSYPPLQSQDFSFNHPQGMCEECGGLGTSFTFDLDKIIDKELSIEEGCFLIGGSYNTIRYGNIYDNLAKIYRFSVKTPWKKLSKEAQDILLYGNDEKWTKMRFSHPEKKMRWTEFVAWRGILHEGKKRLAEAKSESYQKKMRELMSESVCPSCKGSRLKPYPSAAKCKGKTLFELVTTPLRELHHFFSHISLTDEEKQIAEELCKEILFRLSFLIDVGLYYLTIDRSSTTLSGGEAQRVRLAAEIGSGLSGAIYVLDEPSIGLHAKDHARLIATLEKLRDKGNTVIVVEHDEETMRAADTVVDVGPLAGKKGGEILAVGSISTICQSKRSITGKYLSNELSIAIPKKRRALTKSYIIIEGASHHNLQNLTVKIPIGGLVCVTGASGSGKSSLITDILHPFLANKLHHAEMQVAKHKAIDLPKEIKKVIAIDQSPIGRTPRSNPATFVKVFDEIRKLFASTPQSKAKGFTNSYFSFNVKTGSCSYCSGMGSVRVEMDFMEDEWRECPQCEGERFEPEVLSVKYKDHSISDVLKMDVDTALSFFASIPSIAKKLQILQEIGLGYISLGQPSTTISGGEAQRIKLAKELSRPSSAHTLYILDEPTTGLHFHDLNKLLSIIDRLIEAGNSVLVIEHNLDFIKRADWIIDLGPFGGKDGGKICGEGTPETIASLPTLTGEALHTALYPPPREKSSPKQKTIPSEAENITIVGARQNNLKNLSLEIPKGKITFFTGPSGSGKTSLALDTIYAEGQRRYIESLSTYARNLVKQSPKPIYQKMEGLSPSIAIEQSTHAVNPRSTVGTVTEIYDYLRILYAHLGQAYDPDTKEAITTIDKEYVLKKLFQLPEKQKLQILAPIEIKENFSKLLDRLRREGYVRIRLNKEYFELEEEIPYDKKRKNELALVIDRLILKEENRERIRESLEKATSVGGREVIIDLGEKDLFYHLDFTAEGSGKSYPPLTPKTFSFNAKEGMCLECGGLGTIYGLNLQSKHAFFRKSIEDHLANLSKELYKRSHLSLCKKAFLSIGISLSTPLKELSPEHLHLFLFGENKFHKLDRFSVRWRGFQEILTHLAKTSHPSIKETLIPLMEKHTCPECEGSRLNPLARHVEVNGSTITQFTAFPIKEALRFVEKLEKDIAKKPFLEEVYTGLIKYLHFLIEIGLSYLSLDRSVPTLSGGELQRIRLARQLGVGLIHCIYVLDEPTTGLHPAECHLLQSALLKLQKLGNTLIVVEHDPMMMKIADHIIDFGPQGGDKGGEIVFQGSYNEILQDKNSLTGAYLSGRKKIAIPEKRRDLNFSLSVKDASIHNLQHIDLQIPQSAWTCITGVSGSGKSSLVHDLIVVAADKKKGRKLPKKVTFPFGEVEGLNQFEKVIVLDQHLPSLSIRSDICSYSDTLKHFRSFYASLIEAKGRGLKPANFSYHHIRGMCKTCWGLGVKRIDLQFLPPVTIQCHACKGYRLNPLSLQVSYKGKHLGHALAMTVDQASEFFQDIRPIARKLQMLHKVGLGYITLGQHLSTLSGGEVQRLRLMTELSKRSTGNTLYLFDEPTKGLHSEDISHLVSIFHNLVEKKNTLIIIEHNLDMIWNADYLIDIGPRAADEGGKIVAKGRPEDVVKTDTLTAKAMREHLKS